MECRVDLQPFLREDLGVFFYPFGMQFLGDMCKSSGRASAPEQHGERSLYAAYTRILWCINGEDGCHGWVR